MPTLKRTWPRGLSRSVSFSLTGMSSRSSSRFGPGIHSLPRTWSFGATSQKSTLSLDVWTMICHAWCLLRYALGSLDHISIL